MSTDHKAEAERLIALARDGARALSEEANSSAGLDFRVALLRFMDAQTAVMMAQVHALLAIEDKIKSTT